SPWTRQMPSVTEITVPWLRIAALSSRPWIRLLISSLISDGLSCMLTPKVYCLACAGYGLRRQRTMHFLQLGAHRTVQDFIPDHDTNPADKRTVHLYRWMELAAEFPFQLRNDFLDLRFGQREGAGDFRVGRALARILQFVELLRDFRHQ